MNVNPQIEHNNAPRTEAKAEVSTPKVSLLPAERLTLLLAFLACFVMEVLIYLFGDQVRQVVVSFEGRLLLFLLVPPLLPFAVLEFGCLLRNNHPMTRAGLLFLIAGALSMGAGIVTSIGCILLGVRI